MQLTSDQHRRQQDRQRRATRVLPGAKPTRIATLLSFPLSRPGGINTFVTGLIGALERDFRIEHRMIAPLAATSEPKKLWSQLALTAHHFRALARERPEVVVNHEHAVLLIAAVAYRLLISPRARVVHTVHIQPAARLSPLRRHVLGWLLARCFAVTAVAKYTAGAVGMIARPVPKQIEIIHGATDIAVRAADDPAVAELRRTLNLGDGPIVCQVGPLNFPMKVAGVIRLVEAMACVRKQHPDARLLIVGDGEHRASVDQAIRRAGVTDIVRITGFLKDVTVPLAAADVYCQITRQDACPISLLEAMRSGKPIIAARTGGIPELIRDGVDGLLIDVEPGQIKKALLRVLGNREEARAFGQAASERARRDFTWERVAAEYAALLTLPPAVRAS
jgi:glycosyltransferase involved in cell wall biosynthesis